MNTQIQGIHHVTAITSSAHKIYRFFTDILGLRLIKKTVNQDDIQTYHLFFADDLGSAGSDMTFFDFPSIPKSEPGTNSISRTSFRVPSDAALNYWIRRFIDHKVTHGEIEERFGKKFITFEDFDQQQYQLISDQNDIGVPAGIPWKNSNIPTEYGITGLGPAFITIENFPQLQTILVDLLGFHLVDAQGNFHLFEVGAGGNGASIIVERQENLKKAIEGFGAVHHLALRVVDQSALRRWISKIGQTNLPSSGFIDRFYFASEYFRAAPGVLFELATDGPGFFQDETYDRAGENLSLPPLLEKKRAEVEKYVRPLDTSDANKKRN